DHVVDAAEDAVIPIAGLQRAVAGHERPVAPVFAFGIPVVLAEVCLHVAIAVAPDRLHDPRPRIADTDVPSLPGALRDFRAGLIVNDRMNPRHGWAAASRLHRVNRRHRTAEKSAGLGHPPRIGDDRFALADFVIIPAPRFRLDGLTDRRHRFEAVLVFAGLLGPEFAQHPDGGRRGVEDVHAEAFGDAPRTPWIRVRRHALIHHAGRRVP